MSEVYRKKKRVGKIKKAKKTEKRTGRNETRAGSNKKKDRRKIGVQQKCQVCQAGRRLTLPSFHATGWSAVFLPENSAEDVPQAAGVSEAGVQKSARLQPFMGPIEHCVDSCSTKVFL